MGNGACSCGAEKRRLGEICQVKLVVRTTDIQQVQRHQKMCQKPRVQYQDFDLKGN